MFLLWERKNGFHHLCFKSKPLVVIFSFFLSKIGFPSTLDTIFIACRHWMQYLLSVLGMFYEKEQNDKKENLCGIFVNPPFPA